VQRTQSPSPFGWLRSRRARILSRICFALALVGTGIIVGWFAGSDRSVVEAEPTTTGLPGPATPAPADPETTSMPDVRGLATNDARQVLIDVGVQAGAVEVVDQPAAGEQGIVLSQEPVYGYPVSGTVTLSVSTPARVPRIAGRDATDVLADLDELGAEVTTVSRYVPGVAPGKVAAIDPAVGTLLPVAVKVTVAAQADEVFLNRIEAVEDNCWTAEDSLNGVSYPEMFTCETDRSPLVQSWVVKRAAQRLRGVIGIPDSGSTGDRMTLEVLGDGALLTTVEASYGSTTPIDLDIAGVLRLTLRVRSATTDYGTIGLARLALIGDQAQLARLDTW
jgi:hypothetical protein